VLTAPTAAAGVNAPPTQNPGTTTVDPIANDTYEAETFGEVGINATDAGFFPGGVCRTFGSATVKTRSSGESFQSELKDYIPPIDINFSNCSKILITKQSADGTPLAGAVFTVTGNGITPKTCTTDATGTCAIDGLFPKANPYTVTETTAPTGYLNDSTPQQVLIDQPDKTYNVTFTNGLGGVTWEKRDAGTGAKIGGATFVLTATGGDAKTLGYGPLTVVDNDANDEDKDNGEFAVTELFTGNYSLAETVPPTGYELSSPNPKTFTISDATPTRSFIGTTTNTSTSGSFQNPRKTSSLTVKKFNADKTEVLEGAEFTLYRDSNGTPGLQQGSDAVAGTCTTGGAGTCTISGLIWGSYYWVETAPPAGYNFSNVKVQGPIDITAANAGTTLEVKEFTNLKSTIVTEATDANLPGGTITDTATLSGVPDNAQGSITFRAYSDDTCSTLVYTSPAQTVSGPGTYGGANAFTYAPTAAGSYYWIASYSGDVTNEVLPVAGKCGDEGETSIVRPAEPGIQTQVSDDSIQLPAGSVSDKATIQPVTENATGTVDFAVYANDTCTGTPVFTSDDRAITVKSSGGQFFAEATSATFTPVNAGTYYWIATFNGDANNKTVAGKCQDEGETVVVDKAQPSISTQVSDDSIALPSGSVFDTATVTGVVAANPQGTVSFALYANDTCTGTPVFTSTNRALSGAGTTKTATSETFTPVNAGTYYWIATFNGDANNKTVAGKCQDEGETVVVGKNRPDIATQVSDESLQLPGQSVSDSATLTNLVPSGAYGTVDFAVYGPNDSTCSGDPVFESVDRAVTVNGTTGSSASASFTPTLAGTYHWIASYEGDANNLPVAGKCQDEGENVTVEKAKNAIATLATQKIALPQGTISDSATITGLNPDPTAGGTVDFLLYGINDTDCSGTPVFSSLDRPITVDPQDSTKATASSASYTPKLAGVYRWIADYSGDANNSGAKGVCNEEGEISTVDVAPTDIDTLATESATLPEGTIKDTATVSGLTTDPAATGTVTFELYGPFGADEEPNCTGKPIFTSVENLDGNGAVSDEFTPKLAGLYYWIAEYSGDANNAASRGACGEPTEISTVEKAPTDITTTATPQAILGSETLTDIRDAAVVTGATTDPAATGTVTFDLYGPYTGDDEQDCSGTPIFTSVSDLASGDGGYAAQSENFTPTAPGTYLWIARYSGDANNQASAGECGEANEISIVNKPGLTKLANLEVQAPGKDVEYTVTASNTGDLVIKDGVIVDTLPEFVTPKLDSISNGGVAVETDGVWTITWTVDIPANDSVALTYTVTIDEDVPEDFDLVNRATFFDLEATETVKTPLVRDIEFLTGECLENAPYLTYEVTDAAPGEKVTITFVNPDGEDVVISGLPLSGKVLWPGSVIDAEGNPIDWPGWRLEDGVWVEGDEFDWVRPTVTVKVETDGSELFTTTVARLASLSRQIVVAEGAVVTYPDATPVCDAPPPGENEVENPVEPEVLGTKLPSTGAGEIPALAGFAMMLLAGGAAAVATARRRGEGTL
jgi:uncharacterized repeat protein (TIGR01451 family)